MSKKNQLTIRGYDDELQARLEALAAQRGTSLNKAALFLLQRAAGLHGDRGTSKLVGDSLDAFVGTWTHDEEQQLLESIDVLEQVDESLWK